jgi:ABC-type Fe3+/spermidine/putrescine transport system ATPase subunit
MAGVQLMNVSKRFGKVQAMDHINLDVKSGEVLSLLGPSGCGKTTTLRSIVGLEEPSEGVIYIEQSDVLGIPIHKRQVGMVFQDYALFPHLTVQENIAFGLKMQKMPAAVMRSKVAKPLTLVRLAELPGIEGRYPHQLSGGQRQRVALARSLVTEPKVLLLVDISSSPMMPEANTCTGRIRHIVYLGTVTHYYVTSETGEAFVIYRQNQAASPSCGPLCVGDAIHLSWKPEHTLMLENDAEPGDVVAGKESA